MARVVIAHPDGESRQTMENLLQTKGHTTLPVATARSALALIRRHRVDLLLLDADLAQPDSLELCERLRREDSTRMLGIIVVTTRNTRTLRHQAFLKGADDVVVSPSDPIELLLRIEAVLRRCAPPAVPDSGTAPVVGGPYELDPAQYTFSSPNGVTLLTQAEFAIVRCLLCRLGQLVTVKDLLQYALGYPAGTGSRGAVHAHVRKIRKKIEENASNPQIVRTVPHRGYRMNAEAPPTVPASPRGRSDLAGTRQVP